MFGGIGLGGALTLLVLRAIGVIGSSGTLPFWGWAWAVVIAGGIGSIGFGIDSARAAGSKAKQAGQMADRVMDKYGQSDQSAALRTCLRLAVEGKDCERDAAEGRSSLPRKGARAEKCGYNEDKCMSTEDLNAFGKCMRGDEL